MTTKLILSPPYDCTLETDHELEEKDIRQLLEVIDGIATVGVLDEKYYQIANDNHLKQIAVDGVTYQYMLRDQVSKLKNVKQVADVVQALRDNNFTVNKGVILYFNKVLAKYNVLGQWVQLKKELNHLNVPLIYSFPDTFKVFQSNYTISILKLKEYVSMGQLIINHENWEKV